MESRIIFDTKRLIKELGISQEEYKELEKTVKKEFPQDEMMFQLHLLRALKSISHKKAKERGTF